jgi:acyl-CoA thioesterase-1
MKKILSYSIPALLLIILAAIYILRPSDELPSSTPTEKSPTTEPTSLQIIAFGDSLTAGYGLPLQDSYPSELERELRAAGKSVSVINAGISGETSRGNRERAEFIRSQNPDVVILGIGGNDALRGLPISELKKNVSETVEILQSGPNPPKVVLLQMQAPQNAGAEYKREFDAIYTDVAKSYSLTLIPFLVEEVFLNRNLLLSDGIHPNKEGYKILVSKYIYPEITKLLSQK